MLTICYLMQYLVLLFEFPSIAMSSPLIESVRQAGPNCWSLGAKMQCRLVEHALPRDALATWSEGEHRYVLQTKDETVASTLVDDPSDKLKLVHAVGNGSAVWTIGNDVFCKVHYCNPNTACESDIIKFVKEHFPQVPVPDVVHSWIDSDRSFLLIKRVPGDTLQNSWAAFSTAQRDKVLTTVADMIDLLAQQQSNTLQGLSGKRLMEPYLAMTCSGNNPLGPLTREECVSYFTGTSNHPPPDVENFHFHHSDLGPTNIMVSADGEVTGIIDWESGGFFPRFWIATKPHVSPAFDFCPELSEVDANEWRRGLKGKLESKGYPALGHWYLEWTDMLLEQRK